MKQKAEIKIANKGLVDALLGMNKSNRTIRKSVVDGYRRDIIAGNWRITNQGIGVTEGGVLADGQHRLMALKECGYPAVPLLIVYNLDEDIQKFVDAHAKRSVRDLLLFSFDARVSRNAPAIANVLIKISRGHSSGVATNSEIMDVITEYQEQINIVLKIPSQINTFAAPYFAAFVKFLHEDSGRIDFLKKFISSVETGELLTKDMPEFHLRNFLITSVGGGSSLQFERFEKTMKAMQKSIAGEKLGVLRD